MSAVIEVDKKFIIRIVRIYDYYGFIIRRISNGKVYTSEITYPDKETARREAIEQTFIL